MIVETIRKIVEERFSGEATGHDWYHIDRVWKISKHIHNKEGGDLEIIELAALLHDISDHKFNGGKLDEGGQVAYRLLIDNHYPKEKAEHVKYIVDHVSFKGAKTKTEMKSLEGQIVQDADRIDALGAIGIARTFAYGGHRNQPIYDPEIETELHLTFESYTNSKSSSIHHFYEKLLLLTDRMNTVTGRQIAQDRHVFMESFLQQFFDEWNTKLKIEA